MEFPRVKKAKNELAEMRMEMEDFEKLTSDSVLPYGVESRLYVEETGYGRRVTVEAQEDVRFEHEEYILNQVLGSVKN